MSSGTASVYSNGPYHGLPVLPAEARGLTAIITGGNGISGQHLNRVLLSHPDIWTRIISISRRPAEPNTPAADPRVEHIPLDLLSGTSTIATALKSHNVQNVDYVFFTAYKEHSTPDGIWSGQQEMWDDNGKMLEDFLVALEQVNGNGRMKRIVLQTGAKHYGVHYGEIAGEAQEDWPWPTDGPYEGLINFYYRQENILRELAPKHNFTFSVVRPSNILGAAAGNYMNEGIAIGLYISVSRELGTPILFPGTFEKWNNVEFQSSALLNSYIEEWAAVSPHCANESFNAVNGDSPTWSRLWPHLISYFGGKVPSYEENWETTIPENWKGHDITLPLVAPRDRKTHSKNTLRLSITKWSQDPKVVAAWERLRDREGLDQRVWDGASWAFADVILGTVYNVMLGAQKLRRKGFFGTIDSLENWVQVFEDAAEAKLLPKGVKA
ncbi:hypothetical protein EX30DRAFT_320228 [Ascodesmis nigricans]|uniref:PRISE-like Rossmann-fold domain-containing protein n=1 Tax=Ascodesmis nigricans TaxID=341454 RepID=A0A4S2MUZ2_9PEZI|nr:hypothetical protein EX30DRAFT_320228 [Ascodesmis nigricans]